MSSSDRFSTEGLPRLTESFKRSRDLGDGSNGDVAAYQSLRTSDLMIAVKHINTCYKEAVEAEVEAMKLMADCPFSVKFHGLYTDSTASKGVYLAMEQCLASLRDYWVNRKNPRMSVAKMAPVAKCKQYARQICEAVRFLHSKRWMHRDLKPGNVLIGEDGGIRLSDYGLSCKIDDTICGMYSNPICGLAYRAPETMMQTQMDKRLHYDEKVDVWSLLCLLAWLCTGTELFWLQHALPHGKDHAQEGNEAMREEIWKVCGTPQEGEKGWPVHLETYLGRCSKLAPVSASNEKLVELLKSRDKLNRLAKDSFLTPEFIKMLQWALVCNPAQRPTVSALLSHNYFTKEYPLPLPDENNFPRPVKKNKN